MFLLIAAETARLSRPIGANSSRKVVATHISAPSSAESREELGHDPAHPGRSLA
jgi:hypothetical protein